MILGINTATKNHELALVEGDCLTQYTWPASRDDLDHLVPILEELLQKAGRDKSEITEILVIKGPGSFTAVRTGIAFANALAHALSAKLYSLNSFELLAHATPADLIVLHAGGLDVAVYHEGELKVGPIHRLLAPFKHNEHRVYAEVRETQAKELHSICLEKGWPQVTPTKTLCQILQNLSLQNPESLVEALYLKGPHIQKSADKWKQ